MSKDEIIPEDFSGQNIEDDFANDPDVQEHRRSIKEYEEMIAECGELVCSTFALQKKNFKKEESIELKNFITTGSIDQPSLISSYGSEGSWVLFMEYHTSVRAGRVRSEGDDMYLIGLFTLRNSYPTTHIYRETIREKIVDFFVKGDVDFDDQKLFSSKFHVVSRDKAKLKSLLSYKPLDELANFSDMELELEGDKCLFRVSRNPISREETDQFIKLAKLIRRIF